MKTPRLLFLFCTVAMLSSCRKDLAESLQSAQDNAAFETEYTEVYDAVSNYLANDRRTKKTDELILPDGANVYYNDTTFDDGDGIDLTLDYGPLSNATAYKGIPCRDGRYRAGKIHVSMNARWSASPVVNVTIAASDEYYVGNGTKMYKLTGFKTITRTSPTEYTIEVTNATLQRDNGTATWNSSRTIDLTYDDGEGWYNDEYQVSGSASGTNANGVSFTMVTQSPLKKRLNPGCIYTFISGKLLITNSNSKMLELNYDSYNNEACDKEATVTYGGKSKVVTIW